jgi:hypothetical protein
MSKTSPMMEFVKPLVTRALDKKLSKITSILDLISDDNGNIDIEGILSEITENLMTTQPFTFKAPYIGDIEIGGGTIGFSIPLTDKKLVFDTTDLESFKEMLITKE